MPIEYVEEYNVFNWYSYGIEDLGRPRNRRFLVWCNGCRIGQTSTIEKAMDTILQHCQREAEREMQDAIMKLQISNGLLLKLKNGLEQFWVEPKAGSKVRKALKNVNRKHGGALKKLAR